MIKFKLVKWVNFLSTGSAGTTVKLDGVSTTLVVGSNGHGKSTMLDALCFSLYGKPFRNITKNQLINSVNGKGTIVEIEFETEGKIYKVRRGIKPNIFEILEDGNLITQDAALKDYQKVLEKQILKMNHKTFTQVIILGSSSFTPFMKLTAANRREVIEDILDIKIFSTMGNVNKDKVAETKTNLSQVDLDIKTVKNQVTSQSELIALVKKNKQDNTQEYKDKIEINNRRVEALDKDVSILETQISEQEILRAAIGNPDTEYLLINNEVGSNRRLIKDYSESIEFYQSHDECPSCKQGIEHDHKTTVVHKLQSKVDELNKLVREKLKEQEQLSLKIEEASNINSGIQQLKIDLRGIETEIKTIKRQTGEYQSVIEGIDNNTGDLDAEKLKLKTLASKATKLFEQKIELTETRNLQEIASTLLKDSGIKTTIIREYLPLMNQLINKYLEAQDSFIQFEINEQFEETIKSRHRDEFSYASFSEGERQRIDLAILFTWRQIAKLKNSANTNLLVLDEVMDGSLDPEGNDSAQALLEMLAKDGTNIFVISHSVEKHIDKFERVLQFKKTGNYSILSELK